MADGFLGYRASFMLDFVVCALIALVPLLLWSLYLVKVRLNYRAHRNLQIFLGIVLLLTVGSFEIDLQIVHGGWEQIVAKRQPAHTAAELAFVRKLLRIHLIFAITTPLFWGTTLLLAFRRFPDPVQPNDHSRFHKPLGWISVIDLVLTSITGLIFYYYAFVDGAAL